MCKSPSSPNPHRTIPKSKSRANKTRMENAVRVRADTTERERKRADTSARWSGRSGVTEFSSPRHLPRNFWAEHQKEKCPFHFKRKSPPRKYKEARNIFSFWCCRVKRCGGGAIRGAYEKLSHHTARGACTLFADVAFISQILKIGSDLVQ
jgi:hypothetical protein